jgi:hypothetical protein
MELDAFLTGCDPPKMLIKVAKTYLAHMLPIVTGPDS